jgi:hypothetical protein
MFNIKLVKILRVKNPKTPRIHLSLNKILSRGRSEARQSGGDTDSDETTSSSEFLNFRGRDIVSIQYILLVLASLQKDKGL